MGWGGVGTTFDRRTTPSDSSPRQRHRSSRAVTSIRRQSHVPSPNSPKNTGGPTLTRSSRTPRARTVNAPGRHILPETLKPPSAHRRRDVHLSDEDVTAVLTATPERYRPLMLTLVGLGLRINEACGLSVSDVDFLREVVHGREQRRPGGAMGQLKTYASSREIPVDDVVLIALSEEFRVWPRADGAIFSSIMGAPLPKAIAGHPFDDHESSVGLVVSPRSLRHYFGTSLRCSRVADW